MESLAWKEILERTILKNPAELILLVAQKMIVFGEIGHIYPTLRWNTFQKIGLRMRNLESALTYLFLSYLWLIGMSLIQWIPLCCSMSVFLWSLKTSWQMYSWVRACKGQGLQQLSHLPQRAIIVSKDFHFYKRKMWSDMKKLCPNLIDGIACPPRPPHPSSAMLSHYASCNQWNLD